MSTDTIERDILIEAPIDRVWGLITQAEHLGTWFGDAGADIDLRPGGALEVRWAHGHHLAGAVEAVEPVHRFAFRWQQTEVPAGTSLSNGNSTLVEFSLTHDDGATRVRLVESGFDTLPLSDDDRAGLRSGHTEGWKLETEELGTYAARVAV